MERTDFCALILTHGRPDKVHTWDTLDKHGYTGPRFIVIDNEDKRADEYRARFPGQVVMFDKAAIAKTFDEADNFQDRRAIIYARNASFQIARDLGFRYFVQLDDDYKNFSFRYKRDESFGYWEVGNLNNLFAALCDFLETSKIISSVAFAQTGDYLGGDNGGFVDSILRRRKAMNSFVCDVERPFQFVGRINEDVNTYVATASRGRHVFMTVAQVALLQTPTQKNSGGMTDLYLDSGTYVKSFYTVMMAPSCVKIKIMGASHKRLHHKIDWPRAVPMIIQEKHRKPRHNA